MKIYGIKFDENNTAYIKEYPLEDIKKAVEETYCICYSIDNAITECDDINNRLGSGETYIVHIEPAKQ